MCPGSCSWRSTGSRCRSCATRCVTAARRRWRAGSPMMAHGQPRRGGKAREPRLPGILGQRVQRDARARARPVGSRARANRGGARGAPRRSCERRNQRGEIGILTTRGALALRSVGAGQPPDALQLARAAERNSMRPAFSDQRLHQPADRHQRSRSRVDQPDVQPVASGKEAVLRQIARPSTQARRLVASACRVIRFQRRSLESSALHRGLISPPVDTSRVNRSG